MTDWLGTFGSYDSTIGLYLPPPHKSLVVSILSAGTFLGGLLAFPLGDMLGRKGVSSRIVSFSAWVWV